MADAFSVDLNCDVGESFGAYHIGNDAAVFPYLSSVNIACGFHGGDPAVMRKTVKMALEQGLAIGAHPGLPDLQGFGRREIKVNTDEAYEMVVYQIGALSAFVTAEGGRMHHVKPHGALYNMAAKDERLAMAIAEAIYRVNPELRLYGLSGSALVKAGTTLGLNVAHEVFADRSYQDDGTLTPRGQQGALIDDVDQAIAQVVKMVKQGTVMSRQQVPVGIHADTICIHGDGLHAAGFARRIHETFHLEGIVITSAFKH
ncbi:hypothetical protein PBAL39_19469 [Pedobacter sp. BAL39]|uniref:LamB/YcsF family protein n=1 Tax=Pedobacter sp. BAL39 TaxID=391596 RepID=UPI000155AD7F|nr:5-oxoprolinase subunit PxpA [Pedobacter sp. BAL39]EDM34157.1 hypothetical protein PBAL39_19469 [Pedobacter sp. BAL39]